MNYKSVQKNTLKKNWIVNDKKNKLTVNQL